MTRTTHQPTGGDSTFGTELIMDIADCDMDVITDPATLRRYIAALIDRLDMKPYGDVWLHHFGHADPATAGYTAFQPIETSSITLHVSETNRTVHLNVFSCRPFDTAATMDYTERVFGGDHTTYTILAR